MMRKRASIGAAGITTALAQHQDPHGWRLEGTHPELLNNGSGIGHLSQAFFDTVDPLIGEGFGFCA